MGMFVRALAYMMSHGADGLRQVAEDAVLNANYLRARLGRTLSAWPSPARACTRCCSTTDFLKDTGVTTLDFAKALIDEGYHPMTMYFPLVVHGALLIEPTETESKASLDQFAAVLRRSPKPPAPAIPPVSAPPRSDSAPPPRRNRRRAQADPALAPRTRQPRGCRLNRSAKGAGNPS